MAYSGKKVTKGEHPSKLIVRTVKDAESSGSWPRVFLLMGKEDFLVNWSLGYIKKSVLDPVSAVLDCADFSASDCGADDIISACEAYPMMSVRRLVVVENCDFLNSASKWSSGDTERLTEYLPSLPQTTLLVLTASGADKRKALYKAIEKTGIVYDFVALDDDTLAGWMTKRLAASGKKASARDLIRFARQSGYGDPQGGYTLYNLENDLRKAVALTEKETLSLDDLSGASPAAADIDAFRLLDAAFSGNKGTALTILHNTVDSQLPSKLQGTLLGFLGLLCSQLEIMLEAKERSADGQIFSVIQSAMGTNEYRLRKAMDASSLRSAEDLKKALCEAYNIEKSMRTGEMDPMLSMELFIAVL